MNIVNNYLANYYNYPVYDNYASNIVNVKLNKNIKKIANYLVNNLRIECGGCLELDDDNIFKYYDINIWK